MYSGDKTIYFRLDCGGVIGYGHLYRCLSIAENLKELFNVVFIIRKRPSAIVPEIPFPVVWLPETSDPTSQLPFTWIKTSVDKELEDFISAVNKPGIVFVDHYGLNSKWHNLLKEKGFKVAGFRDFKKADVSFDLEIDYGYSLESSKTENKLMGFDYIPLNNKIKEYSPKQEVSNIFSDVGIYIGGAPLDFHIKVYQILNLFHGSRIEWIVSSKEALKHLLEINSVPGLSISGIKEDVFSFYKTKSLFIGACGVSFFERSYLNIPQINFIVADNQTEFAKLLSDSQLLCLAGNLTEDSPETLKENIKILIEDCGWKILEARDIAKKYVKADGAKNISQSLVDMEVQ